MRPNMMLSRTNMDAALLDPAYGLRDRAAEALIRVFTRLGTPEAIMCFACERVFVWTDGEARDSDILPAALVQIERENAPAQSALLCRQCNNDAAVERTMKEMFGAEDIMKVTPTHTGGHA